jgi:predicted small lipoprotein YifL
MSVLNPRIASPLALAVLVTLAGCAKKEPADAAQSADPAAAAAAEVAAKGHPLPSAGKSDVSLTGITKAEGGKTIQEIFDEKAALAGSKVTVRGKAVKVNSGIMGKNWVHIRDGSGANGDNDLTITTTSPILPDVGDLVLVTGTVALDQDFGVGYQYAVILQDAELTLE